MKDALQQVDRLFREGTLAALADDRLLDRILDQGDEDAFAALVARHGPMVLRSCLDALRDPADAEDAFQATFLTLARRAGSIRGRDCLGGWLRRVARRCARRANADAFRRRLREQIAVTSTPSAFDLPSEPDWSGRN
ncbi:MAG: sigma factor [Singulisphaera sp.]